MFGLKTIISLTEICDDYSDLYLSITKYVLLRILWKSIEYQQLGGNLVYAENNWEHTVMMNYL